MNAKPISPILSVSEQIRPEDVAVLFAAGFKSIVCNRPDGEGPDQPDFAEIEAAAKAAGIVAAYLPVVSGQIGDEDAAAFGSLLDSLPKPVLAFCRTGTRSATLWSLSEGGRGRPLPEILAATKSAGYDMSGVIRRIADRGRVPTDG
jgi:sulfide:quinone oxidoreductase